MKLEPGTLSSRYPGGLLENTQKIIAALTSLMLRFQ
jgi:hypothetical protein